MSVCGASNSAASLIADVTIDFYMPNPNPEAFAVTGRLGELFAHYDLDKDEVSGSSHLFRGNH